MFDWLKHFIECLFSIILISELVKLCPFNKPFSLLILDPKYITAKLLGDGTGIHTINLLVIHLKIFRIVDNFYLNYVYAWQSSLILCFCFWIPCSKTKESSIGPVIDVYIGQAFLSLRLICAISNWNFPMVGFYL